MPTFELLSADVEETFLYMMHADILVGSGSELPITAALFSSRTLYFNVEPKHGWNYLAEYVPGAVVSTSGELLTSLYRVRRHLSRRIDIYQKLKKARLTAYQVPDR